MKKKSVYKKYVLTDSQFVPFGLRVRTERTCFLYFTLLQKLQLQLQQ